MPHNTTQQYETLFDLRLFSRARYNRDCKENVKFQKLVDFAKEFASWKKENNLMKT